MRRLTVLLSLSSVLASQSFSFGVCGSLPRLPSDVDRGQPKRTGFFTAMVYVFRGVEQ
jgi:hypothetical protein